MRDEVQGGETMHVFRRVVLFALIVSPSIARTQDFAKVVIKSSASTDPRESRLQILPGGELIAHSVPVLELIGLAYDVPENPNPRLSALPEWAIRERFDIEASPAGPLGLDSKDIETQKRTMQQFLRKLLADHFGLIMKARHEQTDVYALVAKDSSKLSRAAATSSECILDTGREGCHSFAIGFGHPLNARAVDMSDLALYLSNWTDLPVVNRTELNGLFAMHSEGWKPMTLPPPPPGASATGDEFARLPPISVVLNHFGLQLRPQEESLLLYTVERIHPPDAR